MTSDDAEGTTDATAWRFWIVSWTVTLRPFQSPVAFAMSSPTFLGDCREREGEGRGGGQRPGRRRLLRQGGGTRRQLSPLLAGPRRGQQARRPIPKGAGTDETKGTDLRGKSGRGSDLTSDGTEVDDLEGPEGEGGGRASERHGRRPNEEGGRDEGRGSKVSRPSLCACERLPACTPPGNQRADSLTPLHAACELPAAGPTVGWCCQLDRAAFLPASAAPARPSLPACSAAGRHGPGARPSRARRVGRGSHLNLAGVELGL